VAFNGWAECIGQMGRLGHIVEKFSFATFFEESGAKNLRNRKLMAVIKQAHVMCDSDM
jgi:hypothetical protein